MIITALGLLQCTKYVPFSSDGATCGVLITIYDTTFLPSRRLA